jgi:hypothetical protein
VNTQPLTPAVASLLAKQLAGEGIDLLVETGPVVHLTALLPVTTWQEVHALRAFSDVTDARLIWHGAVA